jgi:hypothetical protein
MVPSSVKLYAFIKHTELFIHMLCIVVHLGYEIYDVSLNHDCHHGHHCHYRSPFSPTYSRSYYCCFSVWKFTTRGCTHRIWMTETEIIVHVVDYSLCLIEK